MIFTGSDASSLAASLGCWEYAEYGACALVAIGCGGEYIAEFTDWWTDGIKEKKDRFAKRSTLLLISALALELICLVKTNTISGMLIGSLSDKAGAAEIKAQSSLDKAGIAENKSDMAVEKSNTAKTAAEEAQEKIGAVVKRTDEIKKLVDWRTLTLDQEIRIRNDIMPFKGQEVVLVTYKDDEECLYLYLTLAEITVSAGWITHPTNGTLAFMSEFGVTLRLSPSANESAKRAAERLRSSLKHDGIDCEVTFDPNIGPSSAIQIRVGKRPRMKWKLRLPMPTSP